MTYNAHLLSSVSPARTSHLRGPDPQFESPAAGYRRKSQFNGPPECFIPPLSSHSELRRGGWSWLLIRVPLLRYEIIYLSKASLLSIYDTDTSFTQCECNFALFIRRRIKCKSRRSVRRGSFGGVAFELNARLYTVCVLSGSLFVSW